MSRVITFSRRFLRDHPRAGEPTYFVEKFWNSLPNYTPSYYELINLNPGKEKEAELCWDPVYMNFHTLGPKFHTIRSGNRWKPGDKFSPRVWSGKPYRSPQITIAPDMEVKKIIPIATDGLLWWVNHQPASTDLVRKICVNDGLSYEDFVDWFFGMAFSGQIVCWDQNIHYDAPKDKQNKDRD